MGRHEQAVTRGTGTQRGNGSSVGGSRGSGRPWPYTFQRHRPSSMPAGHVGTERYRLEGSDFSKGRDVALPGIDFGYSGEK
jgi:hypothetical protein